MVDFPFSQAAWGWTMTVPSGAGFTCAEAVDGAVGCPDPTHGTTSPNPMGINNDPPAGACEAGQKTPCCLNSSFVCTVQAAANYTCDKTTTKIVCTSQNQSASWSWTNGMSGLTVGPWTNELPTLPTQCINVGWGTQQPINADLSWHDPPTCTSTLPSASVSASNTSASASSDTDAASKSFMAGPQAWFILFLGVAATVGADFLA